VTCLEHSAALPSGVTCAQFYFTSHIHLLYWCLPLDPSTRSRHPRSPPYHPDNTLRSLPHHFSGLPQKFHQTTCHDRYFPLDIAPGAFGKSISPSLVHTSNSGCEGGAPSKLNKMKSLRRETHHSASLMINGFWPTTDTEMSSPTRTRSLMVPARRINLAPSSRRIFPRARLTISHPPILPPSLQLTSSPRVNTHVPKPNVTSIISLRHKSNCSPPSPPNKNRSGRWRKALP